MRDDKTNRQAREVSDRRVAEIKDRRRYHVTMPANGDVASRAPKNAAGTLHPRFVRTPGPNSRPLMDGANNRKIGGDVFTGRLRGAKILSLALEERATCPSSCLHWRSCYGNNMHRQIRWAHGSNLQAAITRQVDDYFARDPEALLLVRLHVLGDFYSMDYLETWVTLLDKHAGLTVFGFTAYDKGTKIGNAIDRARDALPDQFMIRNSGRHGEMGSMTIDYPTRKSVLQSAGIKSYVCPEQLDANEGSPKETHCGSCALCWESRVNITFIEH